MLRIALIAALPILVAAGPLASGGATSNIQASAYDGQCVVVADAAGSVGDGTRLSLTACKSGRYGSGASWTLPPSGQAGLVKIGEHCLDAGIDPHDGGDVKLWTCYGGELPQQQWSIKADGTIETANGQCLNIKKESDGNEFQTWSCNAEDPQNRMYTIVGTWVAGQGDKTDQSRVRCQRELLVRRAF